MGKPQISLWMSPAKYSVGDFDEDGQQAQRTGEDVVKDISGVAVRYSAYTIKTKLYPAGYEMTDEERDELEKEACGGVVCHGGGDHYTIG